MDFIEVEILKLEAGRLEHRRHGISRRHQKALFIDEINCRETQMRQVGGDLEIVLLRPRLTGEQYGSSTIG